MSAAATPALWSRENLHAWCVVSFDARRRGPEERADMLRRLGFRRFVYGPSPASRSSTDHSNGHELDAVDAEIEALARREIELLAWWFGDLDAADPRARAILEAFRRHGVQPQLWVMQSLADLLEGLRELLPQDTVLPVGEDEAQEIPPEVKEGLDKLFERWRADSMPTTPEEHADRVQQEADRVQALAELAAPYGCPVHLYNHNGWFGMMENQLEIIEELERRGVSGVGIVYNFSHSRDELHDDTADFADLWRRIQAHVVAVNVSGTYWERTIVYPGQGDCELEMMRVIESSGWSGPVGLIAERGGDAEETLRNCLAGLDWLAAELREPGSGGPPPFPPMRRDAQTTILGNLPPG